MKTMQMLVKNHISKWQDTIAKANGLGVQPGSLQMLESSLRESIELILALAEDYGLDTVEPKTQKVAGVAAKRKKSA